MMMLGDKYTVLYIEDVVKVHIPDLPVKVKKTIQKAIAERLTTNPIGFGKPLRYSLKGHRRLRVGDYRIVYRIEQNTKQVTVVGIKHRKDIYAD